MADVFICLHGPPKNQQSQALLQEEEPAFQMVDASADLIQHQVQLRGF